MFDLNTAFYHNHYWFDENGNRLTDNEYAKLLSASTWSEIDPDLLSHGDIEADAAAYHAEMLMLDPDYDRAENDFREYIMGINL